MIVELDGRSNFMRAIVLALAVVTSGSWAVGVALAGDLMYGCCSRPACGKVCKLVCGTATLTAVGYGCECKEICIPGPSQPGCKHCETRCCCDNELKGCPPRIEFCWYDWFACGCAQPRSVRVLTKYQAEKEIDAYHWEVVDGCDCCCPGGCDCVYKPAPSEAQVGDVMALTDDEQVQVTSYLSAGRTDDAASAAQADAASSEVPAVTPAAADEAAKPTAWQRLAKVWPLSHDVE